MKLHTLTIARTRFDVFSSALAYVQCAMGWKKCIKTKFGVQIRRYIYQLWICKKKKNYKFEVLLINYKMLCKPNCAQKCQDNCSGKARVLIN